MWHTSIILSSVLPAIFLLQPAHGHGSLMKPSSWSDEGGEWSPGMVNPCNFVRNPWKNSDQEIVDFINKPVGVDKVCYWFTNFTNIHGERTVDPAVRSFPQLEEFGDKHFDRNPWMSPGSAAVFSPCGALGGNPGGPAQEVFPNAGWSDGVVAEDYYMSPGFPDVVTTEWTAGSVVEATWSLMTNHGGGYSYRLCRAPEEGMGGLTEECFKQGHLEFFGDKQWIEFGEERFELEAVRTRVGTFPEGSQWTRNPIPNCLYDTQIDSDGKIVFHNYHIPYKMSNSNLCRLALYTSM